MKVNFRKMKHWKTTSGCTINQLLKGRNNSYLVSSGEHHILVDTGPQKSYKSLERELDLLEGDLSYLVLTHTHYDHTENAHRIKDQYGAKIIVHRSEAEYLKQGNTSLPKGTIFPTKVLVGVGKRLQSHSKYQPVNPDFLVDEKYALTDNCYLIHTPGHTIGSISLIADNEVALVGDALFGVFRGVFPPFADDVPTLVRSWKKLLDTDCKIFLPGHGSKNTRKLLEKEYAKYKEKFL
jgi:glyoxylase-like metal-dependent hydrolase (beta-lactamase superfamily II)